MVAETRLAHSDTYRQPDPSPEFDAAAANHSYSDIASGNTADTSLAVRVSDLNVILLTEAFRGHITRAPWKNLLQD